jgi:hypothetical protein
MAEEVVEAQREMMLFKRNAIHAQLQLAKARETIAGLLSVVRWARDDHDPDSGSWHFYNGALEKYQKWEA